MCRDYWFWGFQTYLFGLMQVTVGLKSLVCRRNLNSQMIFNEYMIFSWFSLLLSRSSPVSPANVLARSWNSVEGVSSILHCKFCWKESFLLQKPTSRRHSLPQLFNSVQLTQTTKPTKNEAKKNAKNQTKKARTRWLQKGDIALHIGKSTPGPWRRH